MFSVLVFIAAAPLGCLSINSPPKDKTEVKIGGDKGVVVEHPGGEEKEK